MVFVLVCCGGILGETLDAGPSADGARSVVAADLVRPITPADLADAAAKVRSAIAAVPVGLRAAGSKAPDTSDRDRADADTSTADASPAIDWQAIEQQVAAPDRADPKLLDGLVRAIRSQSRGFEPPALRSLADSLRRYSRLVAASRNPAFEADVVRQIGELRQILGESVASVRSASFDKAAAIVESLDETRQGGAVLAEARRVMGMPNLFVEAHESLLDQAVARPVDEVAPIDELILGIRQLGSGHTVGSVRLDLVPSLEAAVLDLVLDATNHSNTRGGKGPVTVCSRGTTELDARRRIQIDESDVHGNPVEAQASARSQTEGIGVRAHVGRNIIRNIASQRAARMRPQADLIAADRARERLRSRFDSQTGEAVDTLASNYQERFRRPLMRHELYPEMLHHNTTDCAVHSAARKMLAGQVAAASPPPPTAAASVLSARVHQTAVANAAAVWLAGRTITKDQVEEEYRRRNVPLPESFSQEVDEDDDDGSAAANTPQPQKPWSVRFASDRPLDLAVGDDTVTATLHGEAFTSGERTVGPMDVKATYRIESSPAGVRLVREGAIEIAPPGGRWRDGDKPNLDERVIRRRLRKRVERVLAESIDVGPLTLPGQLAAAGPLPIERLTAGKDGWINAGWRRKDPSSVGSTKTDGNVVIGPIVQTSLGASTSGASTSIGR